MTTTTDLRSLVEAVGGDRVVVENLAPPQHDPHAVEVKPGQIVRLRGAALLVRVGLDHEPWLRRALATVNEPALAAGGARDLDLSRGVALLQTETPRLRADRATPHLHGFGNPHYWLDPEHARPMTAAITEALGRLAPGERAFFDERRRRFLERLDAGLQRWQEALAAHRGVRMVAMHDTWPYFAARFGLTVVATVEPTPGVPPSPAALGALVERMRAASVRVLVAEPYTSAALARQIADRTGARAVTTGALGRRRARGGRLPRAVRSQRGAPGRGAGGRAMIELLALPFLACLVLTGIHAYLGLHVLARGVIFVDLALAQVAALGLTVALLAGHPPTSPAAYWYALAFAVAGGLIFAVTRVRRAPIPQEAIIGIVYAVSTALTVLVVDRAPQGAEHIKQLLVGSILTVGADDVKALAGLYAAVGVVHWLARRPLLAISLAPADGADGRVAAWDALFYASFALVVTSSVRLAGVLLVFTFLVVPAAMAALLARGVGARLAVGWAAGAVVSGAGLVASYHWDLPTGATIVAAFGAALAVTAVVRGARIAAVGRARAWPRRAGAGDHRPGGARCAGRRRAGGDPGDGPSVARRGRARGAGRPGGVPHPGRARRAARQPGGHRAGRERAASAPRPGAGRRLERAPARRRPDRAPASVRGRPGRDHRRR